MLLHGSLPSAKMNGDNKNEILGVCRAMQWKEWWFLNNHMENCSALNSPPRRKSNPKETTTMASKQIPAGLYHCDGPRLPVFLNLNCNYSIFWVCAGLEGGTQCLSVWTKRNSIIWWEKLHITRGLDLQQKAELGRLCVDLLGRGLGELWVAGRPHIPHWLWKWRPAGHAICRLFLLSTQARLCFQSPLLGDIAMWLNSLNGTWTETVCANSRLGP